MKKDRGNNYDGNPDGAEITNIICLVSQGFWMSETCNVSLCMLQKDILSNIPHKMTVVKKKHMHISFKFYL